MEVMEESNRMFDKMENEVMMLEATIVEESRLLDDGLDGEMTIHDSIEENGYVSAT